MNVQLVQYVIALSEELSFTAAARRCGVSQPTITVGVARLERELGVALFRRKPKVVITPCGWQLLPLMYQIDHAARSIKQIAAAHHDAHRAVTLRAGG